MYKNSDLMPNFPPEGRGPTGVPIGEPIPSSKIGSKTKNTGFAKIYPWSEAVGSGL